LLKKVEAVLLPHAPILRGYVIIGGNAQSREKRGNEIEEKPILFQHSE
jgi:hypothetical protein